MFYNVLWERHSKETINAVGKKIEMGLYPELVAISRIFFFFFGNFKGLQAVIFNSVKIFFPWKPSP